MLIQSAKNSGIASMKAGKLPNELKQQHTWRTRKDPFKDVWDDIQSMLEPQSRAGGQNSF